VAAGFDLARFWRMTPRSYTLMMRGAREADRGRRLSIAEAVRAGSLLGNDDFEKWVAALSGQDQRLPPEAVGAALRRNSGGIEAISMAEALRRMH
jgi:uncharacterized protein